MDVYNKCLKFFEIQSQEPDVERVSNVSGNSLWLALATLSQHWEEVKFYANCEISVSW